MKHTLDDKLHGFIECLVPVTQCNIKCHYCYVIQYNNRTMKQEPFPVSPKEVAQAIAPERFGGRMFISLCGAGETLLHQQMPELIDEILKTGNYVNVTTNGTISKAFDKILTVVSPSHLPYLHFSFSLHLLELKRLNLLDTFFENVIKIRNAGCSFMVQMQACDDYEPFYREISDLCIEKIGAKPQLVLTRNEGIANRPFSVMTHKEEKDYINAVEQFDSPLFNFTKSNFNINRSNHFCFAGKHSFTLNLQTGTLKPCYESSFSINIYEKPYKPINFPAVGYNCNSKYCVNASHFASLGSFSVSETYVQLRDRQCSDGSHWFTTETSAFLSQKFNHGKPNLKDKITSTLHHTTHEIKSKPLVYSFKVIVYNGIQFLKKIITNKS